MLTQWMQLACQSGDGFLARVQLQRQSPPQALRCEGRGAVPELAGTRVSAAPGRARRGRSGVGVQQSTLAL
ncbi:hypothetical protein, partial [Xanthomonas arboricola]|uniref:hypothetical protein n=1 Tax=Xanthomonas arboricola TaxID=56448 RepID=UPI001CBC0D15